MTIFAYYRCLEPQFFIPKVPVSSNNTGVKHKKCDARAACWLASSTFLGRQRKLTDWNLPAQSDASRVLCLAIDFLSRRIKIIKGGGS